MSFIKSIKNALGGSSDEGYDVFGQPTTFVNPFSKDKNVQDHERRDKDDVDVAIEQTAEYALDAEFTDKLARLMNEHTHAVIDMLKGDWKKEREELLRRANEAGTVVEESKEKVQAAEAARRQQQNRANELNEKITELESEKEKLTVDKMSLESRIKAMEARGDNSDELNAKIEELNQTIEELQREVAERDAEIERRDNMPLPADDGPTIEQLNQQIAQRDELIENMRAQVAELEERLNAAAEDLKAAEELQRAVEEVEEFKDKKNSEIASLRQQIIDLQSRCSEFDELRKAHIVLKNERDGMAKTIDQLEQTAKQNADVQNRRSIETGNIIDGLKQQLASATAMAEDYKRKYNSLSVDGNERAANFAKITAERDDVKAELKRTQVTLQKKQHEAQAMNDAIAEKDRRIASLEQQIEELSKRPAEPKRPDDDDDFGGGSAVQDDPAMRAIDDIDWIDDGSLPPHPGEDPRQLSLF